MTEPITVPPTWRHASQYVITHYAVYACNRAGSKTQTRVQAISPAARSSEVSGTDLPVPSLTDQNRHITIRVSTRFWQDLKLRYNSVQAKSVAVATRGVIAKIPMGPFGSSAGSGWLVRFFVQHSATISPVRTC